MVKHALDKGYKVTAVCREKSIEKLKQRWLTEHLKLRR